MNPKDKRNFGQVKDIVRGLKPGVYTGKRLEEFLEERGIIVYNIGSVLQAVTKQTPYLQQLTDGNYMRAKK